MMYFQDNDFFDETKDWVSAEHLTRHDQYLRKVPLSADLSTRFSDCLPHFAQLDAVA
jgi:hypothetical protein